MSDQSYFDELLNVAADPAWRDRILGASDDMAVQGMETLDPAVYRACFNTHAGRAVLMDLYRRYVNVSRFVPNEGAEAGYYREGMAQVVFEIVAQCEAAEQGENDDAT